MMDLKTYGYTEIEAIPDGLLPGRVTELRRERFTVVTDRGEVTAVLKGTFYHSAETRVDFPCVGDFVLLHDNESGDSLIVTVLPRRSKFSRADYSGHAAGYAKTVREQVVATNFDYVFILSSLNWDFKVTRIMLMEQDVMKVQAIREVDSQGRHTTTHRQLFMLPSGTMVIDTPGMRELGLFDADEGIRASFTDVEVWFQHCRFTDCRHQAEPGCAVLAALADGSLKRERWEHYVAQQYENKYVQDKTSYLIDKRARNKSIAMWNKQTKKNGGWKK